jgi:hypothetical protein
LHLLRLRGKREYAIWGTATLGRKESLINADFLATQR